MNLQELIETYDDFMAELYDSKARDGHTVSDEEKVGRLNYGLRKLSVYIQQFDPMITFAPTADTIAHSLRSSSIFGKKVTEVAQVELNGNILKRPDGSRGLWKAQEIERYVSDWRTASSGTPNKAWQLGDKLYLHVPPNSTIAAATNYVAGKYIAADLVYGEDTSEPDVPEELHEAVCYIAAMFASKPVSSNSEAMSILGEYKAEWMEAAKDVRRRNRRMLHDFGVTPESAYSDITYLG